MIPRIAVQNWPAKLAKIFVFVEAKDVVRLESSVAFLDKLCRNAAPNRKCGNSVIYDASGGNHRAALNVCSVEQNAICSDPNIVLDDHAAARRSKPLISYEDILILYCMIGRHNGCVWRDQNIISQLYSISGIQDAMGINITMLANFDVSVTADEPNYSEIIDICKIADL